MMSIDEGMARRVHERHGVRQFVFLFALLAATTQIVLAGTVRQESYASPEAAISGLVDAVKSGNKAKLGAILGPHGNKLISSGDAVADERGRDVFIKAYNESSKLVAEGDAETVLVIGKDDWPFPIPLVKRDNAWKFDTKRGEQEILNRRIGRNELAAIQVCLAIVDAEREYAASRPDSEGLPQYASSIVSTPDQHDGLYWPADPGEPQSPLGPLIAAAASEGYKPALAPYHGYYYRILAAQGKDAPGGEYEYFIKGRMIGGFAVVAYPARYRASGIKTFIVNNDGVVFEKNLGRDTVTIATKMATYNPDSSWQRLDLSTDQ